ncbi:uncharacterized protein [Eurosta solidaginis]|uniref:uncharacterized protein isoform X5 n=1 Tax=Eurosta solidaginis TaxID=178769 RepID=UPI0035307669
MEFQVYTKSEENHLCQLCAEMRENVIEILNEDCEEYITLFRRTLGYLNIEFIEDGVSSKWLCAACLMDAESTDKFLSKVAEGQNKLRQETPHYSGTFKRTVSVKSEDVQNFRVETDSLHNFESSAEVDVKPTYEQFAESDCPTSNFEADNYSTNDCTNMKVIRLETDSLHNFESSAEVDVKPTYEQFAENDCPKSYFEADNYSTNDCTDMKVIRPETDSLHNFESSAEVDVKPTYEQFAENDCPMSYFEADNYAINDCTYMKVIRLDDPTTYSNQLNEESTAASYIATSIDGLATVYSKNGHDTDDGELDAKISSPTTNSSKISQASSDEEKKKKLKNVQKTNSRIKRANKKSFKKVSCHCRFQCGSKKTPQRQEEFFQTYNNSSLAQQVLMISSTAKKCERNIKYTPGCEHRNTEYEYHLTDNFDG